MDITKPYEFLGVWGPWMSPNHMNSQGSGLLRSSSFCPCSMIEVGLQVASTGFQSLDRRRWGPKPYELIGFGDIHGPKPYKFIGFGGIHGPKHYKFIGFGDPEVQN